MNFFEIQLLGVSVYHILLYFFIYSFFGWIWESSYVSFLQKKWVNRGFVSGPILTIYGAGAVSVYLLLKGISSNFLLLYLGGVVVATVLEYITAFLMELVFHMSWWDYSDKKFQLQGRICLESSLFWGVLTLVLFNVFQPMVESLAGLLPRKAGEYLILTISGIYLIDFSISFVAASHLSATLKKWNDLVEDWAVHIKDALIPDQLQEFKEKLGAAKRYVLDVNVVKSLELRQKELLDILEKRKEELSFLNNLDDIKGHYAEFISKVLELRKKTSRVAKRFITAYPKMGNLTKLRKERKKKGEKKEK